MNSPRRTDLEKYLWADMPDPDPLTPAIARQLVSAIVGGDPDRADELADLLRSVRGWAAEAIQAAFGAYFGH